MILSSLDLVYKHMCNVHCSTPQTVALVAFAGEGGGGDRVKC